VVLAGGKFRFIADSGESAGAVMGGKTAVGGLRAGSSRLLSNWRLQRDAWRWSARLRVARWRRAAGWLLRCRGKKAYLQYESELSEAIARLAQLREELKAAIDADAEAYNVVMKAYKAAKDSTDGGRAISAALEQATSVPLAWLRQPLKWSGLRTGCGRSLIPR